MTRGPYIWLMVFGLCSVYVIAPSSVQTTNYNTFTPFCEIAYPAITILQESQLHEFNYHVVNASGFKLNSTQLYCAFHFYNSSGFHSFVNTSIGYHEGLDFFVQVPAEYMTLGYHSFILQCRDAVNTSGCFAKELIEVTKTGYDDNIRETPSIAIALIYIFLCAVFIVLIMVLKNWYARLFLVLPAMLFTILLERLAIAYYEIAFPLQTSMINLLTTFYTVTVGLMYPFVGLCMVAMAYVAIMSLIDAVRGKKGDDIGDGL